MSNSWTESLPRCPLSGCGYSQNGVYAGAFTRHDHEFIHECLNIDFNGVRFYGLFCGYNGEKKAAQFVADRLAYEIFYADNPLLESMSEDEIRGLLLIKFKNVVQAYDDEMEKFLTDRMLLKEQDSLGDTTVNVRIAELNAKLRTGTTALVALIIGEYMYIINCGNSRALLLLHTPDGRDFDCRELNFPHDNDNNDEIRRIEELGVDPTMVHRPTRAIGDFFRQKNYHENPELYSAKGPPVISVPEIFAYEVEEDCGHIILVSDAVITMLEEIGIDPQQINEHLMELIQREFSHGTSASCTSISQAVIDSLLRDHRERFITGETAGVYNRHGDLSLMIISFRKQDATKFTMTNTMSLEEPQEDSLSLPVDAYVDLVDFDSQPQHDAVLARTRQIFGFDITEPISSTQNSIEEERL